MSRQPGVFVIGFLFIVLFLSEVSMAEEDTGKNSQKSEQTIDLIKCAKYVGIAILGLVFVAVAVIKSMPKKTNRRETTNEDFDASFFTIPLNDSILDYLRSCDHEKAFLALQQIVNCPFVSEDVIEELGKIVTKQASYKKAEWLSLTERCRVVRFLHLALERNRSSEKGPPFDNAASFDPIYWASDDCYCAIKGHKKSFLTNLFRQIKEVIGTS